MIYSLTISARKEGEPAAREYRLLAQYGYHDGEQCASEAALRFAERQRMHDAKVMSVEAVEGIDMHEYKSVHFAPIWLVRPYQKEMDQTVYAVSAPSMLAALKIRNGMTADRSDYDFYVPLRYSITYVKNHTAHVLPLDTAIDDGAEVRVEQRMLPGSTEEEPVCILSGGMLFRERVARFSPSMGSLTAEEIALRQHELICYDNQEGVFIGPLNDMIGEPTL